MRVPSKSEKAKKHLKLEKVLFILINNFEDLKMKTFSILKNTRITETYFLMCLM